MKSKLSHIVQDITRPILERILCRVSKQENGCWLWTGATVKSGNGILRPRIDYKRKQVFVYRLMFELEYSAELPSRVLACHSCDNGLCVNPEHIFIGTVKDNTADMVSKGRASWQRNPEAVSASRTSTNFARPYPNKTNHRGVYQNRCGSYGARIKMNKKQINLGAFKTAQEAGDAYKSALANLAQVRKQ